jgi:hypothetical protein
MIDASAIAGPSEDLGAAVGGNKFLASHAVLHAIHSTFEK